MPASFAVTVDETDPDGAVVSARAIDTEIQDVKKQYNALLGLAGTGTSFGIQQALGPVAWLTNQSGGALASGNVVAIDTGNNDAVALSDVSGSWRPMAVYVGSASLANASAGAFLPPGPLLSLTSTGTIARGQYIRKSATTLAVEDAGTAQAAAALIPPGTIGVATAAASGGTVKAILFGFSWPGSLRTNQQNALQVDPFGTAAGNTGETRLLELAANGTNYVGFKAPDSIAANVIWTLPGADGSANQFLQTNGSAVLSFATPSLTGTGVSKIELVRKTADEIVNNSTTLQNDDTLFAALAANEVVVFDCYLFSNQNGTSDIKFAFTVPTGATLIWNWGTGRFNTADTFGGIDTTETSGTAAAMSAGIGGKFQCHIHGVVVNGATSGNLQLQWAQNTATAVDTTIYANSVLIVYRV